MVPIHTPTPGRSLRRGAGWFRVDPRGRSAVSARARVQPPGAASQRADRSWTARSTPSAILCTGASSVSTNARSCADGVVQRTVGHLNARCTMCSRAPVFAAAGARAVGSGVAGWRRAAGAGAPWRMAAVWSRLCGDGRVRRGRPIRCTEAGRWLRTGEGRTSKAEDQGRRSKTRGSGPTCQAPALRPARNVAAPPRCSAAGGLCAGSVARSSALTGIAGRRPRWLFSNHAGARPADGAAYKRRRSSHPGFTSLATAIICGLDRGKHTNSDN